MSTSTTTSISKSHIINSTALQELELQKVLIVILDNAYSINEDA